MKDYKNYRIKEVYITRKEFKALASRVKRLYLYKKEEPDFSKFIGARIYIYDTKKWMHIVGRLDDTNKIIHYISSRETDEENVLSNEDTKAKALKVAGQILGKIDYDKTYLQRNPEHAIYSSKAYTFFDADPDYNGKTIDHCYGYDVNKMYLSILSDTIPDTRNPLGEGIVGPGEIGFIQSGTFTKNKRGEYREHLKLVKEGKFALFRFKDIESPFKSFAQSTIKKIEKAKQDKNKFEETRLKNTVVFMIGQIQNKNPFVRASIVEKANKLILNAKDNNTIYINTDSIVSLVPRYDLEIDSCKVGAFKLEHEDKPFWYKDFNYIWYDTEKKKESIRGKIKGEIKASIEDYFPSDLIDEEEE